MERRERRQCECSRPRKTQEEGGTVVGFILGVRFRVFSVDVGPKVGDEGKVFSAVPVLLIDVGRS